MPYNGRDDDCDPATPDDDLDDDGYLLADDCDDTDALTYPGAPRRLFIDSDCSGMIADRAFTADFVFTGSASQSLVDVEPAGDVDGDGLPDLLFNVVNGAYIAHSLLFLGANLSAPGQLSFDDADHVFVGQGSPTQSVVSSAGDVDGDGLDDLMMSLPVNYDGGEVHLFLGSSLGGAQQIAVTDSDYVLRGAGVSDRAGTALAAAGDIDGDGLDDLMIAHKIFVDEGSVAVVLGSRLGANREIWLADADYTFTGEASGDQAGTSVASAGDIDGDGRPDLLIGAPWASNTEGSERAGRAYVFLAANLVPGVTSLADADYILESDTVNPYGGEAMSYLGQSVSSAGDVDGDGLDDLLIGAPGMLNYSYLYGNGGVAYLMLSANLAPLTNLDAAGIVFDSGNNIDQAGRSVSSADLDGDGLSDLIVGAPELFDYNGIGATYVFLGSQVAGNTLVPDFVVLGDASNSVLGQHVSGLPDLDGDGRDELLMGEPRRNVYLGLSRL